MFNEQYAAHSRQVERKKNFEITECTESIFPISDDHEFNRLDLDMDGCVELPSKKAGSF